MWAGRWSSGVSFLGIEPRWRQILDAPYLGRVTGYPGVEIDAAVIELPGGVILEILDYQVDGKAPNSPATANPGNVHICIETDDIDAMWERAVDSGATPVSPGPVGDHRRTQHRGQSLLPAPRPGRDHPRALQPGSP